MTEIKSKIIIEVIGGNPKDSEQRDKIINSIKTQMGCNADDIILCYPTPTLLPSPTKTETCQRRTDKQRRGQDKLRRRFYYKK